MARKDTTRPKVLSGIVLLLLALLVPAGLLLIAQRMQLTALRMALEGKQADEATQLLEARRALSLLASDVAAKTAAAQRSGSATPASPFSQPPESAILTYARRLADPRYHEFARSGLRVWAVPMYAPLLRQSGLPPAERERYMDLLVDRELARKDASFLAMQQGVYPGDSPVLFNQIVSKSLEPIESELRSLVGDAGMATLADFDQSGRGRSMVDTVSASVSAEAMPLSDAQSLQLSKLLQDQPTAHLLPTIETNFLGDPYIDDHREVAITDSVLQAASSFLSSEQIAVLKTRQQLQQQAGAAWKSVPGNAAPSF